MAERVYGTDYYGGSFSDEIRDKVWRKAYKENGAKIGNATGTIAFDVYGNKIHKNKYGHPDSKYGWEIDHKHPQSRGGTDKIINLQPLQWQENRTKGDIYPYPKPKMF